MKLVKESIDFKRGIDSKEALGLGERAEKLRILNEWMHDETLVMLFKYFSDWNEDNYMEANLKGISGDTIHFYGEYDYEDKMGTESHSISGSFDLSNIESITEENFDATIILKKPVRESP